MGIAVAGLFGGIVASCDRDQDPTEGPAIFTAEERKAIAKLSPLPGIPPNPTNAHADNPEAARLGQRLFFEPRLSANGEISCATCHDPELGFSDGKALSEGIETTDRHSPALWNVAYQRWFFWDGRADSLWAQSLQPLHSEKEMGATPEHTFQFISGDPALRKIYESLFRPFPKPARRPDRRSTGFFRIWEKPSKPTSAGSSAGIPHSTASRPSSAAADPPGTAKRRSVNPPNAD